MHSTDITPGPKQPLYVVYLDYDGVLHNEAVFISPKRGIYIDQKVAPGAVLFEWAPILSTALSLHPDIKIVLSTSWCRHPGFSRARRRLPLDLQARVIGGTYHRRHHGAEPWQRQEFAETARALQILADVARRKPTAWIALDDDIDDWPAEHLDHLVACNGGLGLSAPDTQRRLYEALCAMKALQ